MFIKLTKKEDRQPIWINSAYLVTFEPQRFGSLVVPLGDGFDYEVLETPEEILRMLSIGEVEQPKEEQKVNVEMKVESAPQPPPPPSPPPPPPQSQIQEEPKEIAKATLEREPAPKKEEIRPEFIDGTKEPRKPEIPPAKPLNKRRATRPSQIVRTRRATPARRKKFSEE